MKIKKKIVLIEDDSILGSTIFQILTLSEYEVKWFQEGIGAIKYLNKNNCDFIISDLMMPNMSGQELWNEICKEKNYDTVPFIIITANLDEVVKFSLLESGISDFITKPFKTKELIFKIRNLLNFKMKILKKNIPDPFSKVTIKLTQKDFVSSLNEVLSKNIKSQINTEQLSKMLFTSKSTLDKNIRRFSGKNTSQYMREFRLEYAIKLINLGERNINFLCVESGFNSASYFCTSFKAYTGLSPRDFIKKN